MQFQSGFCTTVAAFLAVFAISLSAFGQDGAGDKGEGKSPEGREVIEQEFGEGPIRGRIITGKGIGGPEGEEGFRKMMANAREMQELQKKYKEKVGELLKAAKGLGDADDLMVQIPKITGLAKEIEKVEQQIKDKRKAMGGSGLHIFGGEGGPVFGRILVEPEGAEKE